MNLRMTGRELSGIELGVCGLSGMMSTYWYDSVDLEMWLGRDW